jgi:hypothetical protein
MRGREDAGTRGRGDAGDAVALKSSANFNLGEIIFGATIIMNKNLFPIIKVLLSFFTSDRIPRIPASPHPPHPPRLNIYRMVMKR